MTGKIEIFADDVWVGNGWIDDGIILDCAATLGPELHGTDRGPDIYDNSERAYNAIEDAIAEGRHYVNVDGIEYTWSVENE